MSSEVVRTRVEMWTLHAVARLAVRLAPPLKAKRIVAAFGGLLPALGMGEAMRVARDLERSGTCLTRAIAIASRVPGAEVVIGSDGPGDRFAAHAWAEREGAIINATAASRHEIARF